MQQKRISFLLFFFCYALDYCYILIYVFYYVIYARHPRIKKNPHKPLSRAVSEKQFYKLYFRYDIIIIIIYFDIFDSANAMYTLFRITANIIRGTRDLKIKLVFLFLFFFF